MHVCVCVRVCVCICNVYITRSGFPQLQELAASSCHPEVPGAVRKEGGVEGLQVRLLLHASEVSQQICNPEVSTEISERRHILQFPFSLVIFDIHGVPGPFLKGFHPMKSGPSGIISLLINSTSTDLRLQLHLKNPFTVASPHRTSRKCVDITKWQLSHFFDAQVPLNLPRSPP